MLYQITRGGQTYGPYTLADLQRYVASGHVLLGDLAKSEEMADWVPVSQILDPSSVVPPAPPVAGYAAGPVGDVQQPVSARASLYPDPPNLGWGLVLLFDVLTFGLFQFVWNIVIALWMKRVQPNSQALIYYAVGYGLLLVYGGFSFRFFLGPLHHSAITPHFGLGLLSLSAWVLRLIARFSMKSSLEEHYNTVEPIDFYMNGVLLFFFGGIYIQSQLNRINQIKQGIRYRSFGR